MKNGVQLAIIIALVIVLGTICANANSDEKIVEELICARTDALGLYYAGQARKDETIEAINKCTMSYLRDSDLANIDRYFQSDVDQLIDYKITDIKVKEAQDEFIIATATINWQSKTLKGEENFTHTYSIICEKEKNLYKLSQFF